MHGPTTGERRVLRLAFLPMVVSVLSQAAQPPPVEWERTFGGTNNDGAYAVQQTSDGGYIIAGQTASFGVVSGAGYLIKTDASGNEEWQKTFGSSYYWFRAVQQTTDGGYIAAGTSLIKTGANGNLQWEKPFGERSFGWYSVQQTTDGGYIVAGARDSTADVCLAKIDFNGIQEWERAFGGADYDYADSVQQTSDGGYIISGVTWSFGGQRGYLVKTDTGGNKQWEKTIGEAGKSVRQTSDGGYIVAGSSLIKTDPNGNQQWAKPFPHGLSCVWQTSDGGYVLSGSTLSFGNSTQVYVSKTDADGNKRWEKALGGPDGDLGYSVQQTSDGGYIVAGHTRSFGAGGSDVYLIKLASDTLPAPNGVSASDGVSTDMVHVTWNASTGASEYCVYRATSTMGTKTAVSHWQRVTTYDDTSAVRGRPYWYWVKARNASRESNYSAADVGWRKSRLASARPSWRLYR